MGGGLPCGAIGATAEVMQLVEDGVYEQVGTFNGNPLTMAAARATLTEILTPDAYAHLDHLSAPHGRRRRPESCATAASRATSARSAPRAACLPGRAAPRASGTSSTTTTGGATRTGSTSTTGGVFLPPWGKCEQWTLSVQHTDEDVDRFLANLDGFAAAVERRLTA